MSKTSAKASSSKRTAILDAARRSFLRIGFSNTNLDEVAATADVSKMTIYSHFGSKEMLFLAVIEDVIAERSSGAPTLDAEVAEADLETVLVHVAEDLIRTVRHPDVVGLRRVLIAEQPRHPELAATWRSATVVATVRELGAFFEGLERRGLLVGVEPLALARQFLWMLIGDPLDAALLGSARTMVRARTSAQQAVRLVLAAHRGTRDRQP
jgi:TetR/AcrR family transcriptional repressor of mexJK operon